MEDSEKQKPQMPMGHILGAEAYPLDSEMITIHLLQSEPPKEPGDGNYKWRQFGIEKHVAEAFALGILEILAAPDTQTAWENISKSLDEHCGDA